MLLNLLKILKFQKGRVFLQHPLQWPQGRKKVTKGARTLMVLVQRLTSLYTVAHKRSQPINVMKYNLSFLPTSISILDMVTIGKNNCALFPTMLQVANGVCLSKSNNACYEATNDNNS